MATTKADSDGATSTSGNKKKKGLSCINETRLLSTTKTQLVPSEVDPSMHCNKRKRDHKRKRKRINNDDDDSSCPASSSSVEPARRGTSMTTATPTAQDLAHTEHLKRLFNKLIVAISTLESSSSSKLQEEKEMPTKRRKFDDDNDNNNTNNYHNYKSLQQTLQHHGATISPQVHKRVHYLLCTRSAMTHATQRVRQAFKRNVDIVDVAWVKECIDAGKIVDAEKYLCNDKVACWIAEKENEKKREAQRNGKSSVREIDEKEHDDGDDENGAVGWSTPIELECCCVCHENGDDDCPWCVDCNLTLDRKKKAKKTE